MRSLIFKLMQLASSKKKKSNVSVIENLPRWAGKSRGHYEVWYITGNAQEYGFWIRYTINVAEDGFNDWAGVWISIFKKGQPPLGLCRKFPLSEFRCDSKEFIIRIGEKNELGEGHCSGSIVVKNVKAEWKLEFSPNNYILKHLPDAAYYLPIETSVLSPNPDLKFTGYIKLKDIDTGEIICDISPLSGRGYQTHIWGKKHAYKWVWGHCNSIYDENGELLEDTFFEGLTVVVKRGPLQLPPISLFYLKYKGRLIKFNDFKNIITNSESWEFSKEKSLWELKSKYMNFVMRMEGDPGNFIMATYTDPDGDLAFCHNSEIESSIIEFELNGKRLRLNCPGTFHTEFGARTPLDYELKTFIYE